MSEYKYNTIASETVEYKSGGGIDIKITVSLQEEVTQFAPGMGWSRKSLDIKYNLSLDGKDQGLVHLQKNDGGEVIAKIGKVGLKQARYSQVLAALRVVESNVEWQKKMEARKQADIIEEEYRQHTGKVDAIMNMGM